jgi:histidyl-tRNA synthetase
MGIPVDIAYRGNARRRMERANKIGAAIAILVGEKEVATGLYTVKDLDEGGQLEVAEGDLPRTLAELGVMEAAAAVMAQDIADELPDS